ncbi:MAG: acyltransferase [Desulfobacterales bacterium]
MRTNALGPFRAGTSLVLYSVNTLFWCLPIFVFSLLKLLVPIQSWRRFCGRILNGAAVNWVGVNGFIQRLLSPTRIEVTGIDSHGSDGGNNVPLSRGGWYLIMANHQSWVDILVLQRIFHRKIPFLKFFIKKELFWVPFLGQAWWALDFPFMKRYSSSFLKKHPHLKGRDIEITKKACEKFKDIPVSVMNFVEGTRFSARKHAAQSSPYQHLLKTRSGGVAQVLGAMGDQMHRILDVTIVYPQGTHSFWSFLSGAISEIKVTVRSLPIPAELRGDYIADRAFRRQFHRWLNTLWAEKDRVIAGQRA